jgi:Fe-S-cluster containining protein
MGAARAILAAMTAGAGRAAIYGGRDEGARPATREAVAGALERGVDPVLVAAHVARGLDAVIAQVAAANVAGEARPACARGCSHCCHQRVEVTAPEVFRLARELGEHAGADLRARLDAAAARARGLDGSAYFRARIACALLDDDGACSAYEARPLACRRAHSTDAEACAAALREPSLGARIPDAPTVTWNASALVVGYLEGLAHAGLAPHVHELHAALALAGPEAEARWRAGEDVLAPARTRSAEELAALLGRAVDGGGALPRGA